MQRLVECNGNRPPVTPVHRTSIRQHLHPTLGNVSQGGGIGRVEVCGGCHVVDTGVRHTEQQYRTLSLLRQGCQGPQVLASTLAYRIGKITVAVALLERNLLDLDVGSTPLWVIETKIKTRALHFGLALERNVAAQSRYPARLQRLLDNTVGASGMHRSQRHAAIRLG